MKHMNCAEFNSTLPGGIYSSMHFGGRDISVPPLLPNLVHTDTHPWNNVMQ